MKFDCFNTLYLRMKISTKNYVYMGIKIERAMQVDDWREKKYDRMKI